MATDDEEVDEIIPPEAADVARRALILKHLHVHALTVPPRETLDVVFQKVGPEDKKKFLEVVSTRHRELLDALRRTGLWEDASPDERRIFEVGPADMSDRDRINVSWRAEGLACIAWALGLIEGFAPYDTQHDPAPLLATIPDVASEFAKTAELRHEDEIEEARSVAELWHWRSRTRQLEEQGYKSKGGEPELSAIVAMAAAQASSDSLFVPIGDDFPAFDKAYRDLSADEWSQARSIAMERHLALNWLAGFAPGNEWDETPTDT